MRQLRDSEMLCQFGCKTIVEKSLASCEMCCPLAVKAREERLIPIIEADRLRAEARDARRKASIEEKAIEEATAPAPKKRGRPANGSSN